MIKVALFEDNLALQQSLSQLLQEQSEFEFVGAWTNGSQVSKLMDHYRPNVVLMDIEMPVFNGLQSLQIINKEFKDIAVIMLTVFEDDTHLFQSICFGAKGYLLKNTPPQKIISAINEVQEGGSPMSPVIARKVLQAFSLTANIAQADYQLTPREKDILLSLVAGNSYKMIGASLNISINTVRQYIRRIYEKLQVHSMSEAVAKAIREHIV